MRFGAKLKTQDMAVAKRIKIINVSDDTIREMGWPKKSDHARMIDILTQHKAAMVAYDWIFFEPDKELIRAVENSGRVRGQDIINLLKSSSLGETSSESPLWRTTGATMSHPNILQHAAGLGHISARNEEGNPQNDGVYRKVALVVDFAGRMFPSLALRVAAEYLRVPLEKIKVTPYEIILPHAVSPDTGVISDIHIPTTDKGEMWVYFPGLWEDNRFEPFWFENVLKQHKNEARWPEYDRKFSGNICFIGNASGKNRDTHVIPLEDNFPSVGIHTAALFTILSRNFIHFSDPLTDFFIILALALIVGAISCYKPPLTASLVHLGLLAGYITLAFWAFDTHRLSLPTIFPALTILLGGVATLGYHFLWEQYDKEHLPKEYDMIHESLQQKEQQIQQLTFLQEKTSRLTEEQAQELAKAERERATMIKEIGKLEGKYSVTPFILPSFDSIE